MDATLLRDALRRALILSLAVPALADQAACGGNVILDQQGTSSAGGAGGSGGSSNGGTVGFGGGSSVVVGVGGGVSATVGAGGGTSESCSLTSTVPLDVTNGGCQEDFGLAGPASICSPGPGGVLDLAQCGTLCPPNSGGQSALSCSVQDLSPPPDSGVVTCVYGPCGTGRRPAGLALTGAAAIDPAARFLCDVAELEAASVFAFSGLANELEAHGAPRRIVRAARRAAQEEERHARVMRGFAERAGARPRAVTVAASPPRSLETIATENAVEGCVRETFGAVIAMRQAERARDGRLRRAMRRIAREEAGHAALAWELARWLDGRLDAGERRRVGDARDRAVEALGREAAQAPDPRLCDELGVPTPAEARAALDALCASIWSPAPMVGAA